MAWCGVEDVEWHRCPNPASWLKLWFIEEMLVTFCTAFYRWRTHYWCRESNVRSGGYGCQQMHHIGLDGVNLQKCIHPGKWGIFKYSLDFCLADIGKVLKNHLTFSGLFLETKYACSCFNYISGQAWTTGIQQWLQSLASDVILTFLHLISDWYLGGTNSPANRWSKYLQQQVNIELW